WINVVDDPEQCSFVLPAILARGSLNIAVSTSGKSPKAAGQIRDELAALYGADMEAYLDLLGAWRPRVKQFLDTRQKESFWAKVTDGEVRALIQAGRMAEAEGVIEQCFQSLLA
ncbi:MAG: bifunctional precorrin-2 dehydrogenase/sirohydrochlorin ferrochelatase, partial [Peptococcaceae bacterium]|nr:bifunctional precorrin-2 dehydrogenase/sirohydrochlorin ferrochelatase [Peptococcaceae bacterium]